MTSPGPVIDSHNHLLPDRLAAKIRAFFDQFLDGDLAYPLDHRAVLDRHFADGVTAIWNLPYAHKAGMADQLNADMAALSQRLSDHPVRVINGCTVHPDDADPVGDLRRATERDGASVLKLHCSVGDYQPTDPRLSGVLDEAGERGLPVVVHAGHGVSGSTEVDELGPIGEAAARHPGTSIIIAHLGHHAHAEGVALLDTHPNLYADLTPVVSSPVPISASDAERLAPRLLFGSDAPNTGCDVATLLSGLGALGLSDDAYAAITGGTARSLVAER